MFFLMKSLLTVLTPPSILHSFQLLHLTHSPISLERNAWVDSYLYYLCELDFLHFVQPQFPHLKDGNNVNISYHF